MCDYKKRDFLNDVSYFTTICACSLRLGGGGLNQSINTVIPGEWPSGLYSLCQVTEVKLGQIMSNSGLVTSEA